MGKERLDNAAPIVYGVKARKYELTERDFDESIEDPIDAQEVFDYIRDINDPEHPYSLEQLNVVKVWIAQITAYMNEKIFLRAVFCGISNKSLWVLKKRLPVIFCMLKIAFVQKYWPIF